MSGVSTYILSVTAAAVVCAILLSLSGQGTMVRLLAGIFMTLTVVSPLLKLELPDLGAWFSAYRADGIAAAAMGEEMAADAAQAFIKEQTESYILDKAALYGASLTAQVSLDDQGYPVSVTLNGEISPYGKKRLTAVIKEDLGIGEEAQHWNG